MKKTFLAVILLSTTSVLAQSAQPAATASSTARYATDAYPGFDVEKDVLSPSRKEPKWFAFINGPNRANAKDQFEYCRALEASGDWSKAAKHYDALVREWPTSPEAPVAQLRLGELYAEKLDDTEEAFAAYRYALDFYSLQCDYDKVAGLLYDLAERLRFEGKTIVFFRFKNTVDVRRAFEAAVLHAPGSTRAPQAMLTIGELREEEGKDEEAIKVYENLKNIHFGSPEARAAILREATVRMRVLREHAYNRERCLDTISFLTLAKDSCEESAAPVLAGYLDEAKALIEEEAYRAACFYDTRMRTRRSAINAYERFLRDYPKSVHAEEIRLRLETLKGTDK